MPEESATPECGLRRFSAACLSGEGRKGIRLAVIEQGQTASVMRHFQRVKDDVSLGRLINREYGMMEQSQRRHLLATQMQNIIGLWKGR